MTIALQQVVFADDGSSSGLGNQSTTQAVSATVSAGSYLWLPATNDTTAGGTPSSASDGAGSYTALDASGTDGNGQAYRAFGKVTVAGGSITATVTYSGSVGYKGVALCEVTGTSGIDVHAAVNSQVSPGGGTDAVVSASVTPTAQPALVLAICMDSDISLPTAGTGFTSGGTGWAYGLGSGASARVESQRITSTAAIQAKYTGVAGTHHYNTLVAVLTESGGGGGGGGSPPQTLPRRPAEDSLADRGRPGLAMPLAIIALSGFPAPPLVVRRPVPDPAPLEDLRSARARLVLPSGVAASPPPPARAPQARDTPLEDLRPSLRWRFPESVDAPTFLLWGAMEEPQSEALPQRSRSLLVSAPAADQPPLARLRQPGDTPLEDLRARLELRLPESVDAPPTSRLRQPGDTMPIDLIAELRWRFPESVDAPPITRQPQARETPSEDLVSHLRWRFPESVDAPPPGRQPPARDTPPEELRARLLWRFPESVDAPPPPRAPQARDTVQEDLRAHLFWRFPESVDAPLLAPWDVTGQTPLEDLRARVLPRLPDPPATPVDQPPAPRWRTVTDTPLDDLRSARARFVLPSGAAPVYQPLYRWHVAAEPGWNEPRLALRVRLPESVDAPPVARLRQPSVEMLEDIRPKLELRSPESVDAPPVGLRRVISDTPLEDVRAELNRRSPESVDSPTPRRSPATTDPLLADLVVRAAPWGAALIPAAAPVNQPPLAVRRSPLDPPLAGLTPRLLVSPPISGPAPQVPVFARQVNVGQTALEDLASRRPRWLAPPVVPGDQPPLPRLGFAYSMPLADGVLRALPLAFPVAAPIFVGFIGSGEVVFNPTFVGVVYVPRIEPTSGVFRPSFGRNVFPDLVGSATQVYEPTFRRRPDQIVALVDDFTNDVFDNSLVHRGGDGKLYLTPLQARDPRRLSLERLRLFLSLLTFRREVAAGEEAGRAFRLRPHQIKIGQPYDPGDAATDLPSIAFLGGEGSTDTYGIGGISLIESTYGFAGPGTVVGRYGEYTEVFTVEIDAESDSKRQGLVAGLKQAFSLHVDSNTLRLLVPEAFDVVAEFELDSVQYLDEPSAAQNRFRARLGVRLTVPELFEVRGVAQLKPFVQLLASETIVLPVDPLRFDLRDDED